MPRRSRRRRRSSRCRRPRRHPGSSSAPATSAIERVVDGERPGRGSRAGAGWPLTTCAIVGAIHAGHADTHDRRAAAHRRRPPPGSPRRAPSRCPALRRCGGWRRRRALRRRRGPRRRRATPRSCCRPHRCRARAPSKLILGPRAGRSRLRRHRRVPGGDHRLRLLVRALPAHHPRLLPERPHGAVVGRVLHGGRHRDEHADLHRHPGHRLRRQHDVPAAGARLRHRPHPGQRALHPGLLPRRAVHLVRAAAAAVRPPRQDALGRALPGDPLARRRHPPVRHRAGHQRRHRRAGHAGPRSWSAPS